MRPPGARAAGDPLKFEPAESHGGLFKEAPTPSAGCALK